MTNKPMITSVIIDDEKRSRIFLKGHIQNYFPELQVVAEAEDVVSGIDNIKLFNPDLIFLDIELPDGSGFDLLEQLLKESNTFKFKVIFTTAFNQFAIKAIKFSALDYLLKPIDADEFILSIKKFKIEFAQKNIEKNIDVLLNNVKSLSESNKKIVLNTTNKTYVYKVNEITRCESSGGYTIFYINDKTQVVISKNLGETEELLKDYRFERIHKSHLINLDYLRTYIKTEGGYVEMENGDRLPVSNRKREYLAQLLKSL